jgi:hypothetical protein
MGSPLLLSFLPIGTSAPRRRTKIGRNRGALVPMGRKERRRGEPMSISSVREGRLATPPSIPEARPAAPEPAPQSGGEPSLFHRMLHGIGREVERGEATVRGALRGGGTMGAGELLALQAGVYRYSEAVDLAAKLVDRASSGVKTVVQGQS